jgi:hypothetical protein
MTVVERILHAPLFGPFELTFAWLANRTAGSVSAAARAHGHVRLLDTLGIGRAAVLGG